jgi:hypothetical protein
MKSSIELRTHTAMVEAERCMKAQEIVSVFDHSFVVVSVTWQAQPWSCRVELQELVPIDLPPELPAKAAWDRWWRKPL